MVSKSAEEIGPFVLSPTITSAPSWPWAFSCPTMLRRPPTAGLPRPRRDPRDVRLQRVLVVSITDRRRRSRGPPRILVRVAAAAS